MAYLLETYQLALLDSGNGCKISLTGDGTALLKDRRKLYIVHIGDTVLYVGEAHTSIKKRFQRSCTAFNHYFRNNEVARNGYKGYKWLNAGDNINRNLAVTVAIFDESFDDNRKMVEAIEGEIVYLIRKRTHKWPEFQNEIHFSNCEGAGLIATGILDRLNQ